MHLLCFNRRLRRAEDGAAAIEYALLIGLIALAIIPALTLLGPQLNQVYETILEEVPESGGEDGQQGDNGWTGNIDINDATDDDLEGAGISARPQREGIIHGQPNWKHPDQLRETTGIGSGQIDKLRDSGRFCFNCSGSQ